MQNLKQHCQQPQYYMVLFSGGPQITRCYCWIKRDLFSDLTIFSGPTGKALEKAEEPRKELPSRVIHILSETTAFGEYYGQAQGFLKTVSGMDPLLEGKLSIYV